MKIKEMLTELLFAPRAVCMGCGSLMGSDENWLCAECVSAYKPLYAEGGSMSGICAECGRNSGSGTCGVCGKAIICRAVAASPYDAVEKRIVANFKFRSVYRMDAWLAGEIKKALDSAGVNDFDVITAVPLHKSRLAERGYNQSEKLARQLCLLTGAGYKDVLMRVRRTKQQAKLSAEERRTNLTDAFAAKYKLCGEKVLLIDDVRTTGSTCAACIKELMRAGASEVIVATFARVVSDTDR